MKNLSKRSTHNYRMRRYRLRKALKAENFSYQIRKPLPGAAKILKDFNAGHLVFCPEPWMYKYGGAEWVKKLRKEHRRQVINQLLE